MKYIIGSLILQSDIPLPSCYDGFERRNFSASSAPCVSYDMLLKWAQEQPDLSCAVKKAVHSSHTVWESRNGWIFEGTDGKNFLTVTRDYTQGSYYSENEMNTEELRPLLESMVECRLLLSGFSVLHAACVALNDRALAFTAPSGTGKSERANCWVNFLGASLLSGDRPLINPADCKVYGAPWDGKEQVFLNTSAQLSAILEIKRSDRTYARRLTREQKRKLLAGQLFIPMWDPQLTRQAFSDLNRLIDRIPIYRLFCDITEESTVKAFDLILRNPDAILPEKDEPTMKLKDGFDIIEIAGDYMAIPVGKNTATFGGSVVLNEVSAFLLKAMKTPVTKEELLGLLLNEYEVDESEAASDLEEILASFAKIGLID